ncbi:MAG: aspartate kinase [Deltaproteobacteria bacterium]|nr:aspartate kinase [Deltaproteobacteria bacterium]
MKIIVKKFGGTSVGSGERLKLVSNIIKNTAKSNKVIVVVSAMSPEKKTSGTTSLLLKAADCAVSDQPFNDVIEQITSYHAQAIREAINSPAIVERCERFVIEELSRLSSFLHAIRIIGELTPISLDNVIAVGEKLSAYILAQTLNDHGMRAEYKDLSSIVDKRYKNIDGDFFKMLQERIANFCRVQDDTIPVVTGYFGPVPGGMIEKIGRGYTDFTSALLTAGLASDLVEELQVWKEVDGVCTADPRKVKGAMVLDEISASEAAELTHFGSEVLHPFTMERVTMAKIPIRVKNTFNPDYPGTRIVNSAPTHKRPVTAITAKKGITVVTITSNRMYDTYGFLAQVFNVLKKHGVVVDLVSTSEISISFTVEKAGYVEKAKADLEALGKINIIQDQSILAVVGENMRYDYNCTFKLFGALATEKIQVGMISKGEMQVNISCVIKDEEVERALPVVHSAFFPD